MAVFAGGAARRPAELPRKVAGVGKGISDGDVGNRLVGGGKHPCGRHDAPVHAIFHGPAMQIPLEQPLADPRADMGRPGQFRHGYFAFQMPVDPGQQGLHALLLLRGGGGGNRLGRFPPGQKQYLGKRVPHGEFIAGFLDFAGGKGPVKRPGKGLVFPGKRHIGRALRQKRPDVSGVEYAAGGPGQNGRVEDKGENGTPPPSAR